MKKSVKMGATQCALSGLMTAVLAVAGTIVAVGPAAAAPADSVGKCSTFTARPSGSMPGELVADNWETQGYKAGDKITVRGTGFAARPEGSTMTAKFDDGQVQAGDQGAGFEVAGANITMPNPVKADGTIEFTLTIPEGLPDGIHNIRLLGGMGGGDPLTKSAVFYVNNNTGDDCELPPKSASDPIEVNGLTQSDGSVQVPFSVPGITDGATVTATLGGEKVQFLAGKKGREKFDSITNDGGGNFAGKLFIPAGKAFAGQYEVTLTSDNEKDKPVVLSVSTSAGLAINDRALNTTGAKATVVNVPVGAIVTAIGVENTNFLTGKDLNKIAGADGTVSYDSLTLKGGPEIVNKNIVVTYTVGGKEITSDTFLKVQPDKSRHNEDLFEIKHTQLDPGLYQSAVNDKNELFVTRSFLRPPLKWGTLYKLDATTLEVKQSLEVAENTDTKTAPGGKIGPYGIGLDNELGYVWVTNTRQNTVAVYKQSDLSLVKQFPNQLMGHPRDVVVDPQTHKAYVSTADRGNPANSVVTVLDGKNLDAKPETITVKDAKHPFGVVMTLDLDEKNGKLYTVSMKNPTAAVIDIRNGNKVEFIDLPADKVVEGSGIALDPVHHNLYIASQETNNIVIYNLDKKQVIKDMPSGGQALNVAYEPTSKLIYATNRTAGTVTAINTDTLDVVANLEAGPFANHISVGPNGWVYLVGKAGLKDPNGGIKDDVYAYKLKDTSGTKPGNPGGSEGSAELDTTGKALIGVFSALGILGAILGAAKWAVDTGIIPRNMIPAWLPL